jgi:hypothetical protein
MRNFLLPLLFTCLHLSAISQEKVDFHEWPKSQKKEILGIESSATSGHVVAWHVGGRGWDRGNKMKLNSYDRNTGAMVAEKEMPWKSSPMRQPQANKGIEWNNALYLVSYAADQGKKTLEFSYAAYDPATLDEVVPLTTLATIDRYKYEEYHMGGLGFFLVPSPDGSKLLVYNGRYTTKGERKNIFLAVLDARGGISWNAEKQLDIDRMDQIVLGQVVSNDGVVDLLTRTREGDKKNVSYSYAIHRLDRNEMKVVKITPPEGRHITGAAITNRNGVTEIHGFLSNDVSLSSTDHVFKAAFPGGEEVEMTHTSLPASLAFGTGSVTHHAGPDGSFFLTGADLHDPQGETRYASLTGGSMILRISKVIACKMNNDMSVAWSYVQGYAFVHKDLDTPSHVACVADDHLVVILPGNSSHLKTYREGKEPKGITLPADVVRMDLDNATGKPGFSSLGGEDLELDFWRFVELQDGRSIYFSRAKKNKKDGFAFVTL